MAVGSVGAGVAFPKSPSRLDFVDWIEGFYNRLRACTRPLDRAPVTRERSLKAA